MLVASSTRTSQSYTSRGTGFKVYRPFPSHHSEVASPDSNQLISTPEVWVKHYVSKVDNLRSLMTLPNETVTVDKARNLYLEVVLNLVTGLVYGEEDIAAKPRLGVSKVIASSNIRREEKVDGMIWPGLGVTMVGEKRLRNIHSILAKVFADGISGDVMETGVWRGGAAIFARAVMRAHDQAHR